jgi:hypothetical protein
VTTRWFADWYGEEEGLLVKQDRIVSPRGDIQPVRRCAGLVVHCSNTDRPIAFTSSPQGRPAGPHGSRSKKTLP